MKLQILCLITLIGLMLATTLFAEETAIARITDVSGNAKVLHNSDESDAIFGMKLFADDKITVGEKGKVILLYETGDLITLNSGENITIALPEQTEESLGIKIWGEITALFQSQTDKTSRAAMVRTTAIDTEKAYYPILYPCNSKLLTPPQKLEWLPSDEVENYILEYDALEEDKEPKQFVDFEEQKIIKETNYSCDNAKFIPGQKYVWRVKRTDHFTPNAWFYILTKEELENLDKDIEQINSICQGDTEGKTYKVLLIALYQKYELHHDAEEILIGLQEEIEID